MIALVKADLIASGHSVTLVDRPDRNSARGDRLTVDAELTVDAVPWALEVMTLRWFHSLERDVRKLKARLTAEFGTKLEALEKTLCMTCHVSSDPTDIQSLVEFAREAVDSGQNQERHDETAQLWPAHSDQGAVTVQPWLGQRANLRDEIVLSSGGALRRKLQGQLAHARELGYRTSLVLDQCGAPDLEYGANWMPVPDTVAAAVHQLEAEANGSVDAIALIRPVDVIHWIRPYPVSA